MARKNKATDLHKVDLGDDYQDNGWNSKSYHVNRKRNLADDDEDLSDDENLALEVAEAKRLQQQAKERLDPDDFDLDVDETDEQGDAKDGQQGSSISSASTDIKTKDEAILYLLGQRPELLPLVDDLGFSQNRVDSLAKKLKKRSGHKRMNGNSIVAEYVIVATYVNTLVFYMKLVVKGEDPKMQEMVFDRLTRMRVALAHLDRVQELNELKKQLPSQPKPKALMERFRDILEDPEALEALKTQEPSVYTALIRLLPNVEVSEEEDIGFEDDHEHEFDEDQDMSSQENDDSMNDDDEIYSDEDGNSSVISSDSELDLDSDTDQDTEQTILSNVPELAPTTEEDARSKKLAGRRGVDDDYRDASVLESSDAADKRSKRHTLRFHASQIQQKADKRQRALGGDDDVPVRRTKQERRNMEQEKQMRVAQQQASKRNPEDIALDNEDDDIDADALDYYEKTAKVQAKKKNMKDTEYKERRAQEKEALLASEEIGKKGVQGPVVAGDTRDVTRGVSYEIMANKGLTPRRNKLNRNPRVKKRRRYETAQKKVASSRPVFKADAASRAGRYSGEQSGVARVVKSRRL